MSVSFTSDDGLSVTALLDADSPTLSGGYGGWEVVDRPKRVGLTRFKGRNPFRQDIPIIFDGYKESHSQESKIERLEKMALQPNVMEEPRKITVDGQAHRTELTWIIEDIEWDKGNVIWSPEGDSAVRLRQAAIVKLLQYVDDDVIITKTSPAVVSKGSDKGSTNKPVPQGMSMRQLALWAYGDADMYLTIFFANPWLNPDPRVIIPAGTFVAIPGKGTIEVTATGTPKGP